MPQTPPLDAARRARAVGVVMLVGASVLWSIAGVAVKTLHLPSITFTLYRSIGAVAAMLALSPLFTGHRPAARWMVLSSLLYTAVISLFITAMIKSTAAVGILLQYTEPVFCALLAWLFQRRRIDGRTILALFIASAGIVVMIAGQPPGSGSVGPVCGLLSGVAFGALILVLEKLDRASGGKANPALIVLYNNLGAIAVLLPMAGWLGGLSAPAWKIGVVAGLGVIQLALPYVLFQLALRRVNPVDASLLTLLEPVLNPLWVAMVTTERPDRFTLAGGAAILTAMALEATKKPDTGKASVAVKASPGIA